MSNELNTMIEARKRIEYCVRTCDDTELTEYGMEAVFDYAEAFNAWAKTLGQIRGPKPAIEMLRKKADSHRRVLDDIFEGYEYADDGELVDIVWEYLPKLARASKALVKAYGADGIRTVA